MAAGNQKLAFVVLCLVLAVLYREYTHYQASASTKHLLAGSGGELRASSSFLRQVTQQFQRHIFNNGKQTVNHQDQLNWLQQVFPLAEQRRELAHVLLSETGGGGEAPSPNRDESSTKACPPAAVTAAADQEPATRDNARRPEYEEEKVLVELERRRKVAAQSLEHLNRQVSHAHASLGTVRESIRRNVDGMFAGARVGAGAGVRPAAGNRTTDQFFSLLPPVPSMRIFFHVQSFDRGERLGAEFKGDKYDLLQTVLREARVLCELGHQVSVFLTACWPLNLLVDELRANVLHCNRTGAALPVHVETFPPAILGNLSWQHRPIMAKHFDEFDLFLNTEDDVLIPAFSVEAFVQQSLAFRQWGLQNRYYPGFVRYEVDVSKRPGFPMIEFEQEMGRVDGIWIEPFGLYATWWGSNPHQGCWMGLREQIVLLNQTCDQDFFGPYYGPWVEFWSGGLQIYQFCHFQKVIPLAYWHQFLVQHMSGNKHHKAMGSVGEEMRTIQEMYLHVVHRLKAEYKNKRPKYEDMIYK